MIVVDAVFISILVGLAWCAVRAFRDLRDMRLVREERRLADVRIPTAMEDWDAEFERATGTNTKWLMFVTRRDGSRYAYNGREDVLLELSYQQMAVEEMRRRACSRDCHKSCHSAICSNRK